MKRIISLGSGVLVVVSLLTMLITIGCKKKLEKPEGEHVRVIIETKKESAILRYKYDNNSIFGVDLKMFTQTSRSTYEYFVDISTLKPGVDFIPLKGAYEVYLPGKYEGERLTDIDLNEAKRKRKIKNLTYTSDTLIMYYPWNGEDELRFLFTPYLQFRDCETEDKLAVVEFAKGLVYTWCHGNEPDVKSVDLQGSFSYLSDYPNVEFAVIYSVEGEWFARRLKDPNWIENPDLLKGLCIKSFYCDTNNLEFLRAFENLTYLILDNTGINDSALSYLAQLSNLRALSLVGTAITDNGLLHLQGLTNLHTLRLDSTSITDEGLVYLKELPNLNYLSISKTHITDSGLVHLTGLSNLQYLMIYGTDVSDAGVEHIIEIKGLRTLGYGETKITEAGLKRLLDVFPEWGKLDQNL